MTNRINQLILAAFFTFGLVITVSGQQVNPTPLPRNEPRTVTQGYIDDATEAFDLVVALRDQLQKEKELNAAKGVTNAALQAQITALDGLIAILQRQSTVYESLLALRDQAFAVYEKIIKIQADMIDRLVAQLNKPKTAWKKFVDGLATIGKIILGVAIGRAF